MALPITRLRNSSTVAPCRVRGQNSCTSSMCRPLMSGSRTRLTVSTSGSSGMIPGATRVRKGGPMTANQECIFCRIIRGEIPGQFVHQDDLVVAFRDIQPAAPTHVLVTPREHLASLAELGEGHGNLA